METKKNNKREIICKKILVPKVKKNFNLININIKDKYGKKKKNQGMSKNNLN